MADYVTKLLMSDDDRKHAEIARELSLMGADGVDIVLKELKSKRAEKLFLLTLSRIIKKEKCLIYLITVWKRINFRPLIEYSENNDPKIRKNAYVIMGEIQDKVIKDTLIKRLYDEETLFLLPSIILSLGNFKDIDREDIEKRVNEIKENLRDEEQKHFAEIMRAYEKISAKFMKNEKHDFKHLDRKIPILLICNEKQPEITLSEARKYFNDVKLIGNHVEILTDDYIEVFNLRTFSEVLLCPLTDTDYNYEKVARLFSEKITVEMLNAWHNGLPPYRYRIELRGENMDRSKEIKKISEAFVKFYGDNLVNSPSDYEVEIRIEKDGTKCSAALKLYTLEDNRFNYRIKTLPASIKGETAAVCVRLISKYLQDNGDILDPFCGTGTMLIERAKYKGNVNLYGVDIYGEAIKSAEINTKAGELKANLIKSDIIKFSSEIKYDEIISNMPYGLRVGSHKENEILYRDFIEKIPQLLKPKGYLFLLTADYRLLKDIAYEKGLKKVDEFVIESGGLLPHLIVYRLPS